MNKIDQRTRQIYNERLLSVHCRTDRAFAILFFVQWIFAIGVALCVSPYTWTADQSGVHIHLWSALVLGGLLSSLPIFLALKLPGEFITRLIIGISQVSYSALLIHLTGGRIETHFHIFGSLAFLSFYRDWRVIVPATLVVAVDHLVRGIFWPESVFGVIASAPWRAFEHAGWVVFEDIFLLWGCHKSSKELREISRGQAELESAMDSVELLVEERTQELAQRTEELEESNHKRLALKDQLMESQKLESIGQLAAGIAHEINTPMQFVNDNLGFMNESLENLFQITDAFKTKLHDRTNKLTWQNRIEEMQRLQEKYQYEYIRAEIPKAILESLDGIKRVIEIVRAMKQLSHPGSDKKVSTDINSAIENTLVVCRNRWKYYADIDLQLAEDLPDVCTYSSALNQVLLNLVVNAADAISEKVGESGEKGLITIRSYQKSTHVIIEIEDTGCGIPEEIQEKIFNPFFTTKAVGQGTGQGLAISKNVIVNQHNGTLNVESDSGEGTRFIIQLPIGSYEQEKDLIEETETSIEELAEEVVAFCENDTEEVEVIEQF